MTNFLAVLIILGFAAGIVTKISTINLHNFETAAAALR